jgi:hypothetical protein
MAKRAISAINRTWSSPGRREKTIEIQRLETRYRLALGTRKR